MLKAKRMKDLRSYYRVVELLHKLMTLWIRDLFHSPPQPKELPFVGRCMRCGYGWSEVRIMAYLTTGTCSL